MHNSFLVDLNFLRIFADVRDIIILDQIALTTGDPED
jgi:hypothetical protein